MVIIKGSTEIKNVNISDPGITSLSVGDLERDTEYNVKVFARNAVFEGAPGQKTIRTKTNGEISIDFYHLTEYFNLKIFTIIQQLYVVICF